MLHVALAGCAGNYEAPIYDNGVELPEPHAKVVRPSPASGVAREHVIRSGDTLYSIAFRYGLDYKDLARWNRIGSPYIIYVGQRLTLVAPPAAAASPAPTASPPRQRAAVAIPPKPPRQTVKPATPSRDIERARGRDTPAPAVTKSATIGALRWQWPARGKVHAADSVLGQRGINIMGSRGQAILAAAPGEVVYSGSGLVGYGKLIIIKHDETFLSAYAHNDELLVAEGAKVAGGQQIAEMGSTGTRHVMLHFEIRRGGKPVPPLQFLP